MERVGLRGFIPAGDVRPAGNADNNDDKSPLRATAHADAQVLLRYLQAAALPIKVCISEKGCGAANSAASASNATCLTDQIASAIDMIENRNLRKPSDHAVRMHALDFRSLAAISHKG